MNHLSRVIRSRRFPPAGRVDRGWVAEAIATEILLPAVEENAVIRSELYVMEHAEKQKESVVIEFLDGNGSVLAALTIPVSGSEKSIIQDYNGTQHGKVPRKVRITLDRDQPSLVFIKEPVYFTPRTATPGAEQS